MTELLIKKKLYIEGINKLVCCAVTKKIKAKFTANFLAIFKKFQTEKCSLQNKARLIYPRMSQLFENVVKQAVMQGSQYAHNSVGKFGSTY